MVLNCQSSIVGITRMLEYEMALKLIEIVKLVGIVIPLLTVC